MHIFFSGIGGVGLGPLAEIAHDAGYTVSGSDIASSPMTEQLSSRGISVTIGQEGSQIAAVHAATPIDWLVYSSAITAGHPELAFAAEHGIKATKRDELLAAIIQEKNLKLIAVAGTHGKTTTSGLLVWAFHCLDKPLSYSVGTTLSFAPSGQYDAKGQYFVYECDEYDRNFLSFRPFLSLITALDYDHPDTYSNPEDYMSAFATFMSHSKHNLVWEKDYQKIPALSPDVSCEIFDSAADLSIFKLAGEHVRQDAFLVHQTLTKLFPDIDQAVVARAINTFPGTARRFEKLADNLYSDYGHHPAEIAATLELAREISDHVVLVYQPHQNLRQRQLREEYTDQFELAEEIYWLPTYLSREDSTLPILTPEDLTRNLTHPASLHLAQLDDELWNSIQAARANNKLVIVMGAGDIDAWARQKLADTK